MKTKSENLHLYPLFFPYEDPGEIPYDEIAWQEKIHPNQLRGMIRSARNNSTIYEAYIELGWRDKQIPWWFARPGRRKNRRAVRVKADYSVKSMQPQITQEIEEPVIRTKIVPETLPIGVESRAPLTPGPVMYLPLNLNESKKLVPYRDGVNDGLGLYLLEYDDHEQTAQAPYTWKKEKPQLTTEQWKIWLKVWYDTKKMELEQQQAVRDNNIRNLQICTLWKAGNEAIRRKERETNRQMIKEFFDNSPPKKPDLSQAAKILEDTSNLQFIQDAIADLKKDREKKELKMDENLATIAEIRRRNRAEKFQRLGIEDPLKVSLRNRGYL
jgi:hypothetical protein